MRASRRRLSAAFSLVVLVALFITAGSSGATVSAASVRTPFGTGLHSEPAYRPPFRPTPTALPPAAGGKWTRITSVPSGFFPGSMLVGLDGAVYIHQEQTGTWYKLQPNASGNYIAGSWTQLASMPSGYTPLYFASQVLSDGKMLIEGGEYNGDSTEVWTNLGAIYDPVHDTWTSVNPPAGWANIGDAQSVVLPKGRFMLANIATGADALFNESTLSWTVEAGTGKADRNDEEGYQLLHNGKVLTINDEQALNNPATPGSQVYSPSTSTWTDAGTLPVVLPSCLSNPCDEELGPMVLRPNGQVLGIGADGHTAVYTGGTTWVQGPDLPGGNLAVDGPAAILPSGKVLVAGSPFFVPPSHFWVYDGKTYTQTGDTANAANDPSFVDRMVVLPTGQVMFDDGSGDLEVYTPNGSPNPSWAPTITAFTSAMSRGGSYSVTGTQLSGLTTGASYGDDYQSSTNYPLVRITNTASGRVTYARTLKVGTHSVKPGEVSTATFQLPATTPRGASTLQVVGDGIASSPVSVTIS
jgi:hypothetical protein